MLMVIFAHKLNFPVGCQLFIASSLCISLISLHTQLSISLSLSHHHYQPFVNPHVRWKPQHGISILLFSEYVYSRLLSASKLTCWFHPSHLFIGPPLVLLLSIGLFVHLLSVILDICPTHVHFLSLVFFLWLLLQCKVNPGDSVHREIAYSKLARHIMQKHWLV